MSLLLFHFVGFLFVGLLWQLWPERFKEQGFILNVASTIEIHPPKRNHFIGLVESQVSLTVLLLSIQEFLGYIGGRLDGDLTQSKFVGL